MKALLLIVGGLAAALSLAVGLNGALAANQSAGAGVKVAVASSGLGRILVDGRGRTLYLFQKDKRGQSACVGQCTVFWPPLIASGKPLATAGAKASLLGTTKRGRTPAGHVQPPPALPVQQGHGQGSDERRGDQHLRRHVVRSLVRWSQGREERLGR